MARGHSALLLSFTVWAGCAGGVVGSDEDGDDSSAIIGGTPDSGDPSVVALFAHRPNATLGSLCTASVISPTRLLTAAHCCDPAVIGSGNVFEAYAGPTFSSTATRLAVTRCDWDPQFNAGSLGSGHDIAVVTLTNPTTLRPIPFNTQALAPGAVGARVRLVGYGVSTHAGSGSGVKRQLSTVIDGYNDLLIRIGGSSQQTCHGDSGGPALLRVDGVERIVGVTSYGYDNTKQDVCYGGGYDTRVDRYATFIQNHL